MTVNIGITDVLSDGTITEVSYAVPPIISLTIRRSCPDEPFTVVGCDVQSRDEMELSEAIGAIQNKIREAEIELLVPIVNDRINRIK